MTDDSHSPSAIGRLRHFDYADPEATYFLTICTQDRLPVFTHSSSAQPVIDCLHWLRSNRDISIYVYCLMPDHLHLLIRPGSDLGSIVKSLKAQTTRDLKRMGRTGKLWQDNYYDRILRRTDDAAGIASYILANPVRKGLVIQPEEHPWSGMPDPMQN